MAWVVAKESNKNHKERNISENMIVDIASFKEKLNIIAILTLRRFINTQRFNQTVKLLVLLCTHNISTSTLFGFHQVYYASS